MTAAGLQATPQHRRPRHRGLHRRVAVTPRRVTTAARPSRPRPIGVIPMLIEASDEGSSRPTALRPEPAECGPSRGLVNGARCRRTQWRCSVAGSTDLAGILQTGGRRPNPPRRRPVRRPHLGPTRHLQHRRPRHRPHRRRRRHTRPRPARSHRGGVGAHRGERRVPADRLRCGLRECPVGSAGRGAGGLGGDQRRHQLPPLSPRREVLRVGRQYRRAPTTTPMASRRRPRPPCAAAGGEPDTTPPPPPNGTPAHSPTTNARQPPPATRCGTRPGSPTRTCRTGRASHRSWGVGAMSCHRPVNVCPRRFAPLKSAPWRFAPLRSASLRSAPWAPPRRSAPRRSAARRFAPLEVRPAEVRPAEVRPAEVRPAEVRPAEVRPAEVRPAEDSPR